MPPDELAELLVHLLRMAEEQPRALPMLAVAEMQVGGPMSHQHACCSAAAPVLRMPLCAGLPLMQACLSGAALQLTSGIPLTRLPSLPHPLLHRASWHEALIHMYDCLTRCCPPAGSDR